MGAKCDRIGTIFFYTYENEDLKYNFLIKQQSDKDNCFKVCQNVDFTSTSRYSESMWKRTSHSAVVVSFLVVVRPFRLSRR